MKLIDTTLLVFAVIALFFVVLVDKIMGIEEK